MCGGIAFIGMVVIIGEANWLKGYEHDGDTEIGQQTSQGKEYCGRCEHIQYIEDKPNKKKESTAQT